jgi:hypothetical protein
MVGRQVAQRVQVRGLVVAALVQTACLPTWKRCYYQNYSKMKKVLTQVTLKGWRVVKLKTAAEEQFEVAVVVAELVVVAAASPQTSLPEAEILC